MAEWGVMRVTWPSWLFAAMVVGLAGCGDIMGAPAAAGRAVPVIYCTDLFHPHDDPDDHFDLAMLYAMPELDIKGIVLDQGRNQLERPGRIPVSQLNKLTGRDVPTAIGLAAPLKSPDDQGLDQPPEFQQGVEFILRTLRASARPVCIATLGSVRDVVAAFNREPGLFRTNVAMVLAFIGEASDAKFQEYNVGLDPHAFVGLMRSGLPVYWVPCFDGGLWQNRGHASFWKASQTELLKQATPEVTQYFIYALEKETSEPLAFLSRPIDPERQARLFAGSRNLWCGPVLGVMSGREVRRPLFGFAEVDVSVSDAGVVSYGKAPGSQKLKRFEVQDPAQYGPGMIEATAGLLSTLGRKGDSSGK